MLDPEEFGAALVTSWGGRLGLLVGVQDVGLWTEALQAYDVVVRGVMDREGKDAGVVRLVVVVRNPLPGDVHPQDQKEGVELPREVVLDWASWREVELARSQPLKDRDTLRLWRVVLLQGWLDVVGVDGAGVGRWRAFERPGVPVQWEGAPVLLCRARVESDPAVVEGHDELLETLDEKLRAA